MAEISIDATNPRLWLMRTDRDTGVDEFIATVEATMADPSRHRRFALIIDMRKSQSKSLSSEARKRASEFIKEHEEWLSQYMICVARVSPDPIVRGILTVYDFFTPGRWSRKTFQNGALAEEWARKQLEGAGVECPPDVVWKE